jgi:D-glycero-D-manno-heptose 1,7-bisphosphate phosphatase
MTTHRRAGHAAAFLDRDGTLNVKPEEHDYVRSPEAFTWLPSAARGCGLLAEDGYTLVVVSNQRGVARGLVDFNTLRAIERHIQDGLDPYGCAVASFRYCPHEICAGCECRKPRPGLLIDAARELSIDLAGSWMIGDSENDVAAGRAAGCRTVLVGGAGSSIEPDLRAASLADAAMAILELNAAATTGPGRTLRRARDT